MDRSRGGDDEYLSRGGVSYLKQLLVNFISCCLSLLSQTHIVHIKMAPLINSTGPGVLFPFQKEVQRGNTLSVSQMGGSNIFSTNSTVGGFGISERGNAQPATGFGSKPVGTVGSFGQPLQSTPSPFGVTSPNTSEKTKTGFGSFGTTAPVFGTNTPQTEASNQTNTGFATFGKTPPFGQPTSEFGSKGFGTAPNTSGQAGQKTGFAALGGTPSFGQPTLGFGSTAPTALSEQTKADFGTFAPVKAPQFGATSGFGQLGVATPSFGQGLTARQPAAVFGTTTQQVGNAMSSFSTGFDPTTQQFGTKTPAFGQPKSTTTGFFTPSFGQSAPGNSSAAPQFGAAAPIFGQPPASQATTSKDPPFVFGSTPSFSTPTPQSGTKPQFGAPAQSGTTPQFGVQSGTTPQFGPPAQFGTTPQFGAPAQFGNTPQFGAQSGTTPQFGVQSGTTPQFGPPAQSGTTPQFGVQSGTTPQFGPPAQFGTTPQFGAPAQFGNTPQFGAQSGTTPQFGAPAQSGTTPQFGVQSGTTPQFGPPAQFGTTPQFGAPAQFGNTPQFGAQSGTTPQFGAPAQFGTTPQFGAPAQSGTTPQFGAPAQFGTTPQFGAPAQFGTTPQFGAPAQSGTTPRFGAPAQFGTTPQFGAPAQFGTTPQFGAPALGGAAAPVSGAVQTDGFGGNTSAAFDGQFGGDFEKFLANPYGNSDHSHTPKTTEAAAEMRAEDKAEVNYSWAPTQRVTISKAVVVRKSDIAIIGGAAEHLPEIRNITDSNGETPSPFRSTQRRPTFSITPPTRKKISERVPSTEVIEREKVFNILEVEDSDYLLSPSLADLRQLSHSELSAVEGFTVMKGAVSVRFLTSVDLTDLNEPLDRICQIEGHEVSLYEETSPTVGVELNVPIYVTIEKGVSEEDSQLFGEDVPGFQRLSYSSRTGKLTYRYDPSCALSTVL